MGNAFVDDLSQPTCAKIIVGDFAFIAGDDTSKSAMDLIVTMPEGYNSDVLLVVAENHQWGSLIEGTCGHQIKTVDRYTLEGDMLTFDKAALKHTIDTLSERYHLTKIDEEIYHRTLEVEEFHDLCCNFQSAENYLADGIGFVIYDGDDLVCGASSYAVYKGGIEIEIDTKESYRRQGLALVCASALILECLKNGLYPNWDAANIGSMKLAEKLGYKYGHIYKTYRWLMSE
jgi:GNAT superfamily N-acetyltransferase